MNINYLIKHALWFSLIKPAWSDSDNVFLFTSRRSGGTWLTEILSTATDTSFVLQPFSNGYRDPFLKHIFPNDFIENSCVGIHGKHNHVIYSLLDSILEQKSVVEMPWNPFDRMFAFSPSRLILKIHNAKHWINCIVDRYPANHFHLHFRHPASQALSVLKRDWGLTTMNYLNDPYFIKNYLGHNQINFIRGSGSRLDIKNQYVLNWCVENMPLLRIITENPSVKITFYENAIISPDLAYEYLSNNYDFVDEKLSFSKPSRTTSDNNTSSILKSSITHDAKKDFLVSRWVDEYSQSDIAQMDYILKLFGADILYSAKERMPVFEQGTL